MNARRISLFCCGNYVTIKGGEVFSFLLLLLQLGLSFKLLFLCNLFNTWTLNLSKSLHSCSRVTWFCICIQMIYRLCRLQRVWLLIKNFYHLYVFATNIHIYVCTTFLYSHISTYKPKLDVFIYLHCIHKFKLPLMSLLD